MDLDYFKSDDLPIDGFLGSNFLKYFNIKINYSKQEITFSRRPISPSSSKSFHFVLDTDNMMNLPIIKIKINGYLTENGLIDTGSPFPILFPINLIRKQTYSDTKDIIESEGIIISWPWSPITKNYITRIGHIELSSLKLKNLPVIYSNTDDVIIGKAFLSQFHTILNYSQKDGYFVPYKKFKFANNIFTTGLSLKKSMGKTIVQAYWKGSTADKAGFKLNDEILELNSKSTSQLSINEINRILNNNKISRITVTKREGYSKRKIELDKTLLFPEL